MKRLISGGSLRLRVMVTAAVLVAMASLVMGLLGIQLLKGYLVDRIDTQLRGFAQIAATAPTFPTAEPPGAATRLGPQLPSEFLVEVIDDAGNAVRVIRSSSNSGKSTPVIGAADVLSAGKPFTAASRDGSETWRVMVIKRSDGTPLAISQSLTDVNDTVSKLVVFDVAAGAAAILLVGIVGFFLVRASLSPLASIEKTAEAIAAGDLSKRLTEPAGKTEVARLAGALNTMLERIEAAYRARESGELHARESEHKMRRFVADASHELRTPLTSIQGFAEFFHQQGDGVDPAEATRLMARIHQEAQRMNLLVEDLFLLAELDQARPLSLHPIDLGSIAAESVGAARLLAPERAISLTTPKTPVIVDADEPRVRQVIDNLIMNALKYTSDPATIDVAVSRRGRQASLVVKDSGPGMTAEHAAHVFERFYRVDAGRSRDAGGSGLGLSIVSAVVSAHGGSVQLDTAPGQGATFTVHLNMRLAEGSSKRQKVETVDGDTSGVAQTASTAGAHF